MTHVLKSFVKQKTDGAAESTSGNFTLGALVGGFKGLLAEIGDGNTTDYSVTDGVNTEEWTGTVVAPDQLTRDTFRGSSTGSPIDWQAGEKIITCGLLAARIGGSAENDIVTRGVNGIDAEGNFIENVADPIDPDDAANKGYTDDKVADEIAAFAAAAGAIAGVTSINGGPLRGIGNAIINGSCQVAKRPVPNLSTSYQYGQVDRIAAKADGTVGAGTIEQAATTLLGLPRYACKLAGVTLTGAGAVYWRYRIEARDVWHLVNQPAIFHCNVYHNVGSSVGYTITVNKADTEDDFSAVTQIATLAAATDVASGADTQIALPVADMGDCSNGVEIVVKGDCGAVTTKDFYINELQIERGATATPFERLDFATVLRACQRYFHRYTTPTNYFFMSNGQTFNTSSAGGPVYWPVEMRDTPVASASGASDFYATNAGGGPRQASGLILNNVTRFSTNLQVTGTASSDLGAAGGSANILMGSSGYLQADAEL